MDKNQGYEIIKAVMLENGRGFALGHHPTAPSPYVTWACYDDKDGQRQYEWGHYGSDRAALEQDFAARVQEYQRLYNVDVRQVEAPGLYKYYSTQRPVDIGTFPKPSRNAPDEIVNYDQRVPVENGAFLAWGHLTYTRPLTCLLYTSKVMYCRMLDAMLSKGQEDENGILFVCCPVTAIAAVLSRSPMTVKRSLNELETAGLIMRVRQGVGEPNRIYGLIPGKEDAALA